MPGLVTCPICSAELPGEAAEASPLFPFCSHRCKQIDLYRWTTGRYAVVEPLTIEQLQDEATRVEEQPPPFAE